MSGRTYDQWCGLAKALDHVGDRWTLLIVRELLLGPRRYSDIRSSLPGIATNLLADRLRDLEKDGIVTRAGEGGAYALTEFGRGLEPVVHDLVRWGASWMGPRQGEEFRPQWLAVALAALLPRRRKGSIQILADGVEVNITRSRVSLGVVEEPDAVIEGAPEAVLGVAAGVLPLSSLRVRGDKELVANVMAGA
jgi:DNA-binding HxlR family transcriptional regulator